MIDLSHTPETPGLRVFLPQSKDPNSWQTWQKPRGFVMATIYAIGPGGGGGGGYCTASSYRGGGGGGGSGGVSRLTIPLFLLPDTLYILVTPGGSGGAGSTTFNSPATAGNNSYLPQTTSVAVYPLNLPLQYTFLAANAGSGGSAGTGTTGGAGGLAGAATSVSSYPLGSLGATLLIAGNAGGQGAVTTALLQGTGSQIYGGAGGGGINSSAPTISDGMTLGALANTPFTTGNGGSLANGAGGNGFSWNTIFPMKIYGGTGSTANLVGQGGNGSAPGAGGGGGGGTSTPPGNRGGDGGPGCVIIQCW